MPRHYLTDGIRRRVQSGQSYIIQGANMSKINNRVLSRKVAQIWGANRYFFQETTSYSGIEPCQSRQKKWKNFLNNAEKQNYTTATTIEDNRKMPN